MKLGQLLRRNFPFFVGAPAFIWQLLFFYIPLICVIALSFGSFSPKVFLLFISSAYLKIIARTILFAFVAASCCLLLAYPVAYWIAFHADKYKNIMLFFLFMPFLTNFLLHVYAWMFVLERGGVLNTILMHSGLITEPVHFMNSYFAIALLMIYCYFPFMVLPLYASLEKFDKRLCEASADLGGTWWQTFWHVMVPLSWPGIRSGFFLVFVPAFGEFAIPELMGGDKVMFVGNVVTHYTLNAQTSSLGSAFTLFTALILIGVVSVLYVASQKLVKRL